MWENYELFRLVAASQVFLAIVVLLVKHARSPSTYWALLLFVGIEAYLLVPLILARSEFIPLILIVLLLSNLLPLFLWLLSKALFQEEEGLSPAQKSAVVLLTIYFCGFLGLREFGYVDRVTNLWSMRGLLLELLPQVFKISLIFLTLWQILMNFGADLVEKRRQLRLGVLIIVGVYTAIIIIVETLFYSTELPVLETVHSFGLVVTIVLVCCAIFTLEEGIFLPAQKKPVLDIPKPAESRGAKILPELLRHLTKLSVYREEGLTIRHLAKHLGCAEYKLREVINGEMGYRNFNELLNQYRIEEASLRLQDPAEAHLPILSIALDVGYRSLSTFNKAFKSRHGMTPSEFRKK